MEQSSLKTPFSREQKTILFLLALIQFSHIVDFMIMMPLGPQLMRLFSLSPQQFGLAVSAYTFSAGLMGLTGVFFMDKFDRKKILFLIFVFFTLGTFACAMVTSYALLLMARIFTGAFGGMLGALLLSIIGDTIPLHKRASAMGFVMGAFSVASVFGVPFGLYLATLFSWHAPFVALGLLGILISAGIYWGMPPITSHLLEKKSDPVLTGTGTGKPSRMKFSLGLKEIITHPTQLWALFFMFMLMIGHFSIIPFISPYMVSNVGFTEKQLSYIYLFGGAFTIFTSPLIGKLSDRHGRRKIFSILLLLSLFPIFVITNLSEAPLASALVTTSLFFVLGGGRMIPAMTMITSVVPPKQRGRFLSVNATVQQLTAGVASLIAGMIITKTPQGRILNYSYVGYIAIGASLLCLLMAHKIKPSEEHSPKS